MHDRSKNQRWINGCNVKVRALIFNEIPGRLLGKGLAGSVAGAGILQSILKRQWIPIGLGVGVARIEALEWIDKSSKGGSDDDTLN